MYINKNDDIKKIITSFPETIDIFTNNGLKGLDNEEVLEKLSKISLEEVMKLKKMNVDSFIGMLEESIKIKRDVSDITMAENVKTEGLPSIVGLLPCPVRIPLLNSFTKFLDENKEIKVNTELKAASSGLAWLKEDVINAKNEDALADVFLSAGFDLFFQKDLMGKFKSQGVFRDLTEMTEYNKDFTEMKDPEGDYSMIGVVPAIFLVNKDVLGDRPFPKTWKDILRPEFKKSISLPISDFDLFNSILLNIHKNYGDEGVEALGGSLLDSMHPAEMLKASKPAVTIMPYFFSKMVKQGGPMEAVWPEDGAIISPIFMLTKKSKEKEIKEVASFMSGKEVGEILSHQGLFPSVNPEVENSTSGKPMMWIGWDYIYSNDIGSLITHCENKFNEGVAK